jgi:hypothetical protein
LILEEPHMAQGKAERKRIENPDDIPEVKVDFEQLDKMFKARGRKGYHVDIHICDDDDADGGKSLRYRRVLDK